MPHWRNRLYYHWNACWLPIFCRKRVLKQALHQPSGNLWCDFFGLMNLNDRRLKSGDEKLRMQIIINVPDTIHQYSIKVQLLFSSGRAISSGKVNDVKSSNKPLAWPSCRHCQWLMHEIRLVNVKFTSFINYVSFKTYRSVSKFGRAVRQIEAVSSESSLSTTEKFGIAQRRQRGGGAGV